jgi:hypothetical protein
MSHYIDQREVGSLCAHLSPILQAELRHGNVIAEVSAWPPKCRLLIILEHPFGACPPQPRAGVAYRLVDDPHYWLAEYACDAHGHLIACGFAPRG